MVRERVWVWVGEDRVWDRLKKRFKGDDLIRVWVSGLFGLSGVAMTIFMFKIFGPDDIYEIFGI